MKYDVPAITLGTGLTTLGVLRCLGRRGIPAYCMSADPEMEAHSRWYRELTAKVGPLDDVDGLVSCLKSQPLERAVLIACSDHWVLELNRLPEELRDRFPYSCAPQHVSKRFIEKRRFLGLVREAGVPHPRSSLVDSPGEVSQLASEWGGRVFLKPSNSQLFHRRFGTKAIRADSVEAAVSQYAVAQSEGLDFILQEYIPGGPRHHYFIDGYVNREHRLAACFARRRLRMYPRDFGNSSYMVSVPVEEVRAAVRSLETLFATSEYRGIFSAEFKRDERDGLFKILEVNCRPWWYVEFAAQCGVDVVEMAYLDALGRAYSPPSRYETGARLVYPYYDYRAIREETGRLGIGTLRWLGLLVRAKQPVGCWDDPIPWFSGVGALAARRLNRWFKRPAA